MPTIDTTICPNCHKDNLLSAKHCRHCGIILSNNSNSSIPNVKLDLEATAGPPTQRRIPPASPLPSATPHPLSQQPPTLSPQSVSARSLSQPELIQPSAPS